MFRNLFPSKPVRNKELNDIDPTTSNCPALAESSSSSNAESEEILTLQQIPKLKHSKSSGRLINRAEIEKQANSGDPEDSFDPYSPSILRRSKSLPLRVCSKLLFPALNRKRSVKFAIPEKNEETGSDEYRCIDEDKDLDISPFKDRYLELCSVELETISDRESETNELNIGKGVKNQSSGKYPDVKLNIEDHDQFHNNSPNNFDVHDHFISGLSRQSKTSIFKPLKDQSVPNTCFENNTIRDSKGRGQSGSCLNSLVFQLVDEYSSEESNSSTLSRSFGEGDEIQCSLKKLVTLCQLEVPVEFHTSRDLCSLLNRIGGEMAAKYDNNAAKNSSAISKVNQQLETLSINEAHIKMEYHQLEEEKKSVFKIIEKFSQIDEYNFDLCVYIDKILTERDHLTGRNRELEGIVEELEKSPKPLQNKLMKQNTEIYNYRHKENELIVKSPDYSEGVKLDMTTETPESNFCSKSIISSLSTQASKFYNSNSYLTDKDQENNMIISTLKSSLEATILERDSLQSQLKQHQIILEEKVKLIEEQNTNKSMNGSTQEKGTIQAFNCDLELLQQLLKKFHQELCEARPDYETNRSEQELKINAVENKTEIARKRIKLLERAIESSGIKLTTLNHLILQIRLKVQQAEDIVRFGFDNCEYLISKDQTQIETLEEMVKVLELHLEQVLQYSILQKGRITDLERVVCEAETIFLQPNELELIQGIVKEITDGYETKERQYEECNQFLRQSFENSMKDQRLLHIENTELHATIENMKEVLSKLKRDQEQLTSRHDAVARSNQVLLLTLLSLTKDSFDCLTPILRDDAISHFKRLHKWLQKKYIFSESDKFLLEKLCKYIVKVENEVFLEYSSNEEIMIGIISGENEKLKEVDINRHRERKR